MTDTKIKCSRNKTIVWEKSTNNVLILKIISWHNLKVGDTNFMFILSKKKHALPILG